MLVVDESFVYVSYSFCVNLSAARAPCAKQHNNSKRDRLHTETNSTLWCVGDILYFQMILNPLGCHRETTRTITCPNVTSISVCLRLLCFASSRFGVYEQDTMQCKHMRCHAHVYMNQQYHKPLASTLLIESYCEVTRPSGLTL